MDERGLDELLDSKVRGAKTQRARMTVAGILAFGVLLTAGAFGVRHMREMDPASQSTTKPTEAVTEQAEEPVSEATEAAESDTETAEPAEPDTETAEQTEVATEAPTEPEEGTPVTHHLTIRWPEEGLDGRPDNVYIKVFHEGEEVAFLELNEKKNWTVSWEDTYTVRQLDLKSNLPEGLNAAVRVEGSDFTVTVTSGDGSATAGLSAKMGTLSDVSELPQTGGDWRTPGRLALSGIGFLAAGLTLKRRELA